MALGTMPNLAISQDLAGSPNKNAYYTWKTDGGGGSYSQAGGTVYSSGAGGTVYSSGGGAGGMVYTTGAVSPSHGHSYAQQVNQMDLYFITNC